MIKLRRWGVLSSFDKFDVAVVSSLQGSTNGRSEDSAVLIEGAAKAASFSEGVVLLGVRAARQKWQRLGRQVLLRSAGVHLD